MPWRSFCRLKAAAIAHGSGKAVLVWVFEPGLPSENSTPPSVFLRVAVNFGSCQKWMTPSQAYPSTLTGAGLPVPIPDGRGPEREARRCSPRRPLSPLPRPYPFCGGLLVGFRALRGWPILCAPDEPFAHSSLVRHLASTRTPSLLPPISTVLSRPFVVEARFSARPFRSGDARGRFGSGDIVDHFDGAPIDTGRTGEPEAPSARSGKIMVHDSHTLSLASSPRRRVLDLVDAGLRQVLVVDRERQAVGRALGRRAPCPGGSRRRPGR